MASVESPPPPSKRLKRVGTLALHNQDPSSKDKAITIRILTLFPGGFNDQLLGDLSVRTNNEDYEALSYHWGAIAESQPTIRIVDKNNYWTSRDMSITHNLELALKHLRYSDKPRRLWIDAVCINQDDTGEKSRQIPIMDRIYGEATNVCVWLGESSEKTKDVIRLIEDVRDLSQFDARLKHSGYTHQWDALLDLMKREWFSRRWIVQEIAFAKKATVHCGHYDVPWPDLADAVALFSSRAPEITTLFREDKKYGHRPDYLGDVEALGANRLVTTLSKLFRKSDDGQKLEKLLALESLVSNLSAFNAGKPHDIIYAILSLANDARPVNVAAPTEMQQRQVSQGASLAESPSTARLRQVQADRYGADDEQRVNKKRKRKARYNPALQINTDRANGAINNIEIVNGLSSLPQPDSISGGTQDALSRPSVILEAEKMTPFTDETVRELVCEGYDIEHVEHALKHEAVQGDVVLARAYLVRAVGMAKEVIDLLRRRVKQRIFVVDYDKRFYEVCKDFVNFVIRTSDSLDMLCRPWAPDSTDPPITEDTAPLPSWICTLSRSPLRPKPDGTFGRVNADLLVGLPESGGKTYHASRTTRPEFFEFGTKQSDRHLFVHGFVLDEIEDMQGPALEGNIPQKWLELGNWIDPRDDPPESFWRTLVADRDDKGHNPPTYYRRACKYAFEQRVTGGSLNTGNLIATGISKIMADYLKRVQTVVWMRRLIKTKRDHRLGLAPEDTKTGDLVCILRGCSVPVILRKTSQISLRSDKMNASAAVDQLAPEKETADLASPIDSRVPRQQFKWHVRCQLIGECYMHGVMDGEAFKVRDENDISEMEFEIE